MKRVLSSLLLAVALGGAGCGGATSTSTTTRTGTGPAGVVTIPGPPEARHEAMTRPPAEQVAQRCPPGQATMGCAQLAIPQQRRGPALALPNAPFVPDVSEFQGAVNWAAVAQWQRAHGWHPEAIFKMGEFRLDSQAARTASQTRALGFWRAGYIFTRNLGCQTEAAHAIAWARQLGLRVVIEDNEVPEARGYAACVTPRLRAAGLIAVEYSSPGSNPDSSNPHVQYEWVAAYGPSHPPCLFTCSVGALSAPQTIVAWQETDGQFGTVVSIPGIGRGDVSLDFGISKLGSTPTVAGPVCFTHRVSRAQCAAVKQRLRALGADEDWVWLGRLAPHGCRRPFHRHFCVSWGRRYNADWLQARRLREAN